MCQCLSLTASNFLAIYEIVQGMRKGISLQVRMNVQQLKRELFFTTAVICLINPWISVTLKLIPILIHIHCMFILIRHHPHLQIHILYWVGGSQWQHSNFLDLVDLVASDGSQQLSLTNQQQPPIWICGAKTSHNPMRKRHVLQWLWFPILNACNMYVYYIYNIYIDLGFRLTITIGWIIGW